MVQVNYQTVVGWHPKKMLRLMEENPSELILTLKKRPRHHHNHLGIYMKPFRDYIMQCSGNTALEFVIMNNNNSS